MNTKLEYLYRDAGNYKQWREVVICGTLSLAQIKPYLIEGEFFIPEVVGLPGLAERFAEQGLKMNWRC